MHIGGGMAGVLPLTRKINLLQVTVYTRPNCQPCKATKRRLDILDINYDTVDLDDQNAAEFKVQGLGAAPIVQVDLGAGATWSWSGFAPTQIEILDHAFGCDDPDCGRCEAVIAA